MMDIQPIKKFFKSYSYVKDSEAIQVEISTKCNAQCPSCIRTDNPSLFHTKSFIPKNKEMPLSVFEKLLDSKWSDKNLRHIEFCGTMDEPLMHSEFTQMIEMVYEKRPDIKLSIHTNGSVRNPDYFRWLG